MKFAVMGTGEFGGRYGGRLVQAGLDVTFIARGQRYEEIKRHGLHIQLSSQGRRTDIDHVQVTDAPVEGWPRRCRHLRREELSPGRSCRTDQAAARRRHGRAPLPKRGHRGRTPRHDYWPHIRARLRHRRNPTRLGNWMARCRHACNAVWEVLKGAGVNIEAVDDIRVPLWNKLIGLRRDEPHDRGPRRLWPSGSIAGAQAAGVGGGRRSRRSRQSGGRAHRSRGWATRLLTVLDSYSQKNPRWRPSLLQDLEAGRRLELEDLVGVIVHKGTRHGIPTPVIRVCYMTLKPYEMGAPSSGGARVGRGSAQSGG